MAHTIFKKDEALGEEGYLEVLNGPAKGAKEPLSFETIHIGRSPDNDIVIEEKGVSRHHSQISFEDDAYYISDLNTSNGTLVNKKRILNQKLQHGDIIQVGHMIFRFLHSQMPGTSSQPEIISRSEEEIQIKKSRRPLLFILFGILVVALIWFWVASQTPLTPLKKVTQHPPLDSEPLTDIPQPGSEAYSINWEKSNQFYLSGYREYSSQNFLRAWDDFRASLELYPDHRLAKIYLKKTEDAITAETDQHYKSGLNYFNSGQYESAIYQFQTVMALLKNRTPPDGFCSARFEKRTPIENSDFEKYCDSEQKISEAQGRMSGQEGF